MKTVDCAVFWDIENIPVPRGYFARDVVTAVRERVIKPNSLKEIDFYCACDPMNLQRRYGIDLESENVTVVQVYNIKENAADNKLMERMRNFLERSNYGSAIVLLSGDGDFVKNLRQFKETFGVTVHVIHRDDSTSKELLAFADRSYIIENILIRANGFNGNWFIKVSGFNSNLSRRTTVKELRNMSRPYMAGFVSVHHGSAHIQFNDPSHARLAAGKLNGMNFHGQPLIVAFDPHPPKFLQQAENKSTSESKLSSINATKKANNSKKKVQQSSITKSFGPRIWNRSRKNTKQGQLTQINVTKTAKGDKKKVEQSPAKVSAGLTGGDTKAIERILLNVKQIERASEKIPIKEERQPSLSSRNEVAHRNTRDDELQERLLRLRLLSINEGLRNQYSSKKEQSNSTTRSDEPGNAGGYTRSQQTVVTTSNSARNADDYAREMRQRLLTVTTRVPQSLPRANQNVADQRPSTSSNRFEYQGDFEPSPFTRTYELNKDNSYTRLQQYPSTTSNGPQKQINIVGGRRDERRDGTASRKSVKSCPCTIS